MLIASLLCDCDSMQQNIYASTLAGLGLLRVVEPQPTLRRVTAVSRRIRTSVGLCFPRLGVVCLWRRTRLLSPSQVQLRLLDCSSCCVPVSM